MVTEIKTTSELSSEILLSIRAALEEDIRSGDVTTETIVSADAKACAQIVAKQDGIVAGLDVAEAVFLRLDENLDFRSMASEGEQVTVGQTLATLFGSARALLTAERTALNFLGRMSGIATLTRQFVEAVAGTSAVILDTRKTAPGLRTIDKLAVRRGGGQNHRTGLYDLILIKDNHIDCAGSLVEAVRRVRQANTSLEIEIEARTIEDVTTALKLGIDRILLDNMKPEVMRRAVQITARQAKLEASGNVTIENVRQIALTGVDFISVGALTHSPKVFDVSLGWEVRENHSGQIVN